jgi:hypothetical protein
MELTWHKFLGYFLIKNNFPVSQVLSEAPDMQIRTARF